MQEKSQIEQAYEDMQKHVDDLEKACGEFQKALRNRRELNVALEKENSELREALEAIWVMAKEGCNQ